MKKEFLDKICRFFASQKKVLAVYLYGSQAKKTATTRSDLDLVVLFVRPLARPGRILELGAKLQKALGNNFRIDLREIHLGLSPVFLGEVISQGEVVFCRDEMGRVKFEVTAMRLIDDSQRIQQINLDHLKESFCGGTYAKTA